MHDIIFVAYLFKETDGVGALRSISLSNLLQKDKKNIKCIHKNSFKENEIFLSWLIKMMLYIIKHKPNTIYVSCGPFYHLYPLAILSKFMGINLLVDFRDPWSLNIKDTYGKKRNKVINTIKFIVSTVIEKQVYHICRYFIVCTTGMCEEYTKLFKDGSKIKLITNGHSLEINNLKPKPNNFNNILNFVCIGKFAEYSIDKAINSLELIKMFSYKSGNDYKIHLIGSDKLINQKAIKLSGISNTKVIFYERKTYKEAIELAKNFDIGICIVRNERLEFGTKIFDYIGLGLPVIGEFEKSEHFYGYFKNIIIDDKIPKITIEDKKKYYRENIFKEFLNLFEKE